MGLSTSGVRGLVVAAVACAVPAGSASASYLYFFSDASGLSGEAEFSLQSGGTELVIRFQNTSTGIPGWMDNSDQILTGANIDILYHRRLGVRRGGKHQQGIDNRTHLGVDNGQVQVIYQVHNEPGGKIPSWLVNSIVITQPYNTLKNMKKLKLLLL